MARKNALIAMFTGAALAIGCTTPRIITKEEEPETTIPAPKEVVPGWEWMYTTQKLKVDESRYFKNDQPTILYVPDVHAGSYQKKILGLIDALKEQGFRGVIGLEGLTGKINDTDQEQRMRNQIHWIRERYGLFVNQALTSEGLGNLAVGDLLNYCADPPSSLRAPGLAYSKEATKQGGDQATVIGIEDDTVYEALAKREIQKNVRDTKKSIDCFIALENDDFNSCDGWADNADILKDPEKTAHYRTIRDSKALLREMQARLERNIACLETPQLTKTYNEMNDERSVTAVNKLLDTMHEQKQSTGLLIMGVGHQQVVLETLQEREISYIVLIPHEEKL